jgi:hypothetical protein
LKIKAAVCFILALVFLSGCESNTKSIEANSPKETNTPIITTTLQPTPTKESQIPNVSFEISPLSVNHEVTDTSYYSESYRSEGTITVKASEPDANKPYLVLINVTQTNKTNAKFTFGTGYNNVIVVNGKGSFSISSSGGLKKEDPITKPEYKVEVIGYLPYNLPN